MRTFSYIIVPALALLNMGVNGAAIANVLTARHPAQLQGASAFRRGLALDLRQVHNADFSSSTASTPAAAAPASDPAPAAEPAGAAAAARRADDDDVTSTATNAASSVTDSVPKTVLVNSATREVHTRQDVPAVDTTADTDSADPDDDETTAEADPDVEDAAADSEDITAADTADTAAVTRAVHARQDEDDAVDPTVEADSADASEDPADVDAASDVEDAAADTAAVTRAIHARQDEEDDTVDPTTANDSADADEDDTAEDEDAAAEPTETPDSLATAQDLTTQVPDEESLDARAVAPTIGKRQVAQSPSGNTNVIASDLQGKVAVPGSSGSSDTFPGSIDVSLPGSRRSIMKQLGRRAPQQGAAGAGAIAGAVGLGNSGSN